MYGRDADALNRPPRLPRLAPCLALLCLVATARSGSAQSAGGIASLSWLAGCWELRAGARVTEEQWMTPDGGVMLGLNRSVVRDTTREWEFLSIIEREGRLVLTAKPSRQAEASFTSEFVSDTSVLFTNPTHDFPQRIIYRRLGRDSLVARVEGLREGQMRGIDFPMRRVPCE